MLLKIIALILVLSLFSGCEEVVELVPDGDLLAQVTTDQAAYQPGAAVTFDLTLRRPVSEGKLLVRYRQLNETIKEEEFPAEGSKLTWSWTPPDKDHQGYMVELILIEKDTPADHANIAVDVSSDWGKFPRYGYLADFPVMGKAEMTKVMDRLNRFHINGIQFYDWQYKHQMPVKWEDGKPAAFWPDIANRPVALETVRGYIDLAHERNMKAMNYNLLYGGYEDAEKDGVRKEWGLFKDPQHNTQDQHPLPDSWASDIYMYDPANPDWQSFLFREEKRTLGALPFDGWHVDQLGGRGNLWSYDGKPVDLGSTFGDFLKKAKENLNVDLVMNAVGQYGQESIAQAPVKFLYTEVWEGHPQYRHLKEIADQNNAIGQNRYSTVFAAYMNYKLSNETGQFNTPAILLADAVMFASGASHLELGENMLSKEYFPHKNLKISVALEEQLVSYYDFLVAYQNLLRDGLRETSMDAAFGSETGLEISRTAEQGKVWALSKEKDGKAVVHLINFTDAATMDWNDTFGKQAEPQTRENLPITFNVDKPVKKIWLASPDFYQGSAVEAAFKQENGQLHLTVPRLKYWDMIVMEF